MILPVTVFLPVDSGAPMDRHLVEELVGPQSPTLEIAIEVFFNRYVSHFAEIPETQYIFFLAGAKHDANTAFTSTPPRSPPPRHPCDAQPALHAASPVQRVCTSGDPPPLELALLHRVQGRPDPHSSLGVRVVHVSTGSAQGA